MDYIKYNDQQIPVRFNYRTIKNVKDKFGIDLSGQSEQLQSWITDLSNQEQLFFEMIACGYRLEKKDNPFTLADMVDILSEPNTYADFLKIYQKNAIEFITPTANKAVQEQVKKKVVQS